MLHFTCYKLHIVVLLLLSLSARVKMALATVIYSSSSLYSLHCSLIAFSIPNLQLLSLDVLLHSPPTHSRSLLAHSSHRILRLPRPLFPSTFWAPALLLFFISHSFHMFGPFQPTPQQFRLKTFFHSPTSTLSSSILLLPALFNPTILLIQLFSQTCTFSCCLRVTYYIYIYI